MRQQSKLNARIRAEVGAVIGYRQTWAIALGNQRWATPSGQTGRYWIANGRIHVRRDREQVTS